MCTRGVGKYDIAKVNICVPISYYVTTVQNIEQTNAMTI